MTALELFHFYEQGGITQLELFPRVASLITPDNAESILATIPPAYLEPFRAWACAVPEQGGIVVGSNISDRAAQQLASHLAIAVPVIRDWFHSHASLSR